MRNHTDVANLILTYALYLQGYIELGGHGGKFSPPPPPPSTVFVSLQKKMGCFKPPIVVSVSMNNAKN